MRYTVSINDLLQNQRISVNKLFFLHQKDKDISLRDIFSEKKHQVESVS